MPKCISASNASQLVSASFRLSSEKENPEPWFRLVLTESLAYLCFPLLKEGPDSVK
jgi:hypothetical protein